MKVYCQTDRFLSNVEKFGKKLDDLSILLAPLSEKGIPRDGKCEASITSAVRELSSIVEETEGKGNPIMEEVLEACQDASSAPDHLNEWLAVFDRQIRLAEPGLHWVLLTHSVEKGEEINNLISRMWANIENVAECFRFYASKYGVEIEETDGQQGIGQGVSTSPEEVSKEQTPVTSEQHEYSDMFSVSRQLPSTEKINDLITFLIKEGVIIDTGMGAEAFLHRIRKANYSDIVKSKNRMKETILYIAKTYFGDNVEYRRTASKSIGIELNRLTDRTETEKFLKDLKRYFA